MKYYFIISYSIKNIYIRPNIRLFVENIRPRIKYIEANVDRGWKALHINLKLTVTNY